MKARLKGVHPPLQQPPFVYKHPGCIESQEKYSRCFYGYCIDLLNKIQEDLKFNYTIRNVSDYGYMGEKYPHDWTGMVRELKDRVLNRESDYYLMIGHFCKRENLTESGHRVGCHVCHGGKGVCGGLYCALLRPCGNIHSDAEAKGSHVPFQILDRAGK
jgi:hypothetical protein